MGTWRFHNITTDTDFWPVLESINITDSQPCALSVFSGRIVDDDALSDEDEVEVLYAADDVTFVRIFGGFVSIQTDAHIEPIAEPGVYPFSARDYTTLLEDTILTADRDVTESVEDRVLWIMGQGNDFGVTTGGVAAIATMIGPGKYKLKSKRQALDEVAAVGLAVFYVDRTKDLQFYPYDDVIAAPFDLVTPASSPTSYPYRAFTRAKDATDRADVVLAGNSDGTIIATRTRPGAPAASLRKQRAIVTDLESFTDLEAAADAELVRIGLAQQDGSLVCWQPGLFSGMTVHITNPTHGIDDDFVISGVSARYVDPNPEAVGGEGGHAEFTISFADRLLCIPQRDQALPSPTKPDCSDCTRTVAILPSGMDENLSLAEGRGGMHVYDGTDLAKYNCAVQLVAGPSTTSAADLNVIYHEPVHEAIFAGDRAFYTGAVGPHGDDRWTNASDAVTAGATMDIRRAWAVVNTSDTFLDSFTRADTTPPALGTADSGETWAAATGGADSSGTVAGGATIGVVSNKLKYVGGTEAEKTVRGAGPWSWVTTAS